MPRSLCFPLIYAQSSFIETLPKHEGTRLFLTIKIFDKAISIDCDSQRVCQLSSNYFILSYENQRPFQNYRRNLAYLTTTVYTSTKSHWRNTLTIPQMTLLLPGLYSLNTTIFYIIYLPLHTNALP